jgi:hypothetical protein
MIFHIDYVGYPFFARRKILILKLQVDAPPALAVHAIPNPHKAGHQPVLLAVICVVAHNGTISCSIRF